MGQFAQPLLTDHLSEAEKMLRPVEKPAEPLFGNLKVLGVACLHIGFVENVVLGGKTMLVAGPSLDQPLVAILGETAEEFEIVRRRTVVSEREEQA